MDIKTLHLVLFSLTSLSVFSQSNEKYANVKVSYGLNIHFDKNNEIYKIYEEFSPGLVSRIEAIDSEFDFSLVFNDSTSLFYLEKKLYSDNRAVNSAIIQSGYYGRIMQQNNQYIEENLQEDFGKFLVSRSYQKWELQEETKMIGDYLCFKATTFYTTTNPKGKVFKNEFTAWYTPQLPYKFGPAGYGNLPGLIMELQGKRATYGVTNIQFYKDDLQSKENEIPRLKRKKLITEIEFEKLAAEDEKRWLERNK